jgi:formate-dependent nitrite reductase membrane component NrfD
MTISIALSLLLASFHISKAPWSHSTGLRHILSVLAVVSGFGVAFYPGLLLGRMPGRPFWNGPLLAPLFLLSGLSTGVALFCLIDKIWPTGAQFAFCSFNILNTLFMAAQLIGWSTYVYLKRSFASPKEATALRNAFAGGRGLLFWGGFVGLGLILPGALYLTCGAQAAILAHLLVLMGAFMMRGFVVTADYGASIDFSR